MAIAPKVAEVAVYRAIEGLEGRYEKDHHAARLEDRGHPGQRLLIVFDVLENVHAQARVRLKPRQVRERWVLRIADQGVQIRARTETFVQARDAIRFDVERDHDFAV